MPTDYTPGIYNLDYFSGAQVGIYIGDILIDEVTSIEWQAIQNRTPIFGYANQYFSAVSKGPVLIQGTFTINFKEAGYLWLVLDTYKKTMEGKPGKLFNPFTSSQSVEQRNIEQIINGETTTAQRTAALKALAENLAVSDQFMGPPTAEEEALRDKSRQGLTDIKNQSYASLGGFSSISRSMGVPGTAESWLEAFEDTVWQQDQFALDNMNRRADDPDLNPFDIFIGYGDFAGDNRVNHTIRKLSNVHIIGSAQRIVIDGQPIQEQYTFIAQNIV